RYRGHEVERHDDSGFISPHPRVRGDLRTSRDHRWEGRAEGAPLQGQEGGRMSHQMSFDEYRPPAQRHSPTSIEAAESIRDSVPSLQSLVFAAVRRSREAGLTDEEGIDELKLSPSTYRPRRIELVGKHLVVDSGGKRKTRSGRDAVVWIVPEYL